MPAKALPMANRDVAPCCVPLTGDVIDVADAEPLAAVSRRSAMPPECSCYRSSPHMTERKPAFCDLTEPVGLSQPTVSHHMKQLADAGLVSREPRGRWAYYRIVDDALASLALAITPR